MMLGKFQKRLWITFLLICFGLLTGCGGGGGGGGGGDTLGDSDIPAQVNLTGVWQTEEAVSGNCSSETYPYTTIHIYTTSQSGNSVIMQDDMEDTVMTGTVSGYTLTFSKAVAEGDGNTTISFNGTCSENGESFNGSAQWTYSEPGYSCSGTTQITGTKTSDIQVDATGDWTGTYSSQEYSLTGTFSASIVDNAGELTGTISVPYIGITDTELTGTVVGSVITFGDISGLITFSGILTEGGTATGSYVYDTLDDEGNWNADRS
jgi:hypothetical protein